MEEEQEQRRQFAEAGAAAHRSCHRRLVIGVLDARMYEFWVSGISAGPSAPGKL
jgi:hypothetical protein